MATGGFRTLGTFGRAATATGGRERAFQELIPRP